MKKHILTLAAAFLVLLAPLAVAQHGHLNVGVLDTDNSGTANSGDQLGFKNGNDWAYDFVNDSGYTHNATSTTLGNIANYYGGSAFTFAITPTAISGDSGRRASINATTGVVSYSAWESFAPSANGSEAVAGAMTGSFLQLELVSVTLLSGNATSFSFWGGSSSYPPFSSLSPAAEWTFAGIGAGALASGSSIIDLTSMGTRIGDGVDTSFPGAPTTLPSYPNDYSPEAQAEGFGWNVDWDGGSPDVSTAVDPYGHIHGRSWAANGTGVSEFELVWRAVDANGIQVDSEQLTMKWSTVPEPGAVGLVAVGLVATLLGLRRRRVMIS